MSQGQWLVKSGGQKKQAPSGGLKISIPKFDNSTLITGYSKTLIGRCMNPPKQEMNGLLYHLPQIWNVEERVVGADLGLGRFQFDFQEEEDIIEVLKKGPFHFDNWMLSVVRWEPVVEDNYPSKITFWVRAIGVPLHFWAEPTFKSIGDALGEVRGDDAIDINDGKIRVILDAFKPLVFSITVEFHSGEETVIALRYDRLHGFCRTCSSLRHDQSRCPTTKGATEDGDVGPSDKPDQGGKALSYKGAVESQHTENTSGGESRRQNQQGAGKQDVKGKGIAYEGGRQGGVAKSGPGRRYRENGRPTARYVRQAGYLPPHELNDSYVMATSGINGLRNQEVGGHLDTQQKLMLEAFKSGAKGEVSESKARKALLFESEGHEEGLAVTSGGDPVETVQRREEVMEKSGFSKEVATAETEGMEGNNFVECSNAEQEGMQVLEMGNKEEVVSSEMVAGLDEEDGHLEYEMMEDGVDDVSSEREASGDLNSMDVVEASPVAESEDLVGEKEHQVPKKKNGKITAAAMGGNAKKRLVQSLVSPRKKAMAKQGSKAGDKGQVPTRKALIKPKPDQD
ncbi:uncharacterized protein LOC111199242 [Brassica napus]|uniref:uncharacterized protein LOC111199242 n=1 Tax=Brassica napus TaxID=3708 RepID=UPI002078920D|nr:uncharacterized protein LOC111199242 [Brassica napus]